MPLDEFIAEVMQILHKEGEAKEVCVKRVDASRARASHRAPRGFAVHLVSATSSIHPLRFAAEAGQEQYQKFFEQLNDRMHK